MSPTIASLAPERVIAASFEEEKDRSTLASEEGFTGTLKAFLEWLKDSLSYGSVSVTEATPEYAYDGSTVMRVETVTGGFSSDEHLLARVQRNYLMAAFWMSSHRGGLTVYQFPKDWYESVDEHEFLAPEDDVFERVHRARHIRVYTEHGDYIELNCEAGAELLYQEPARDINEPDALLIVRPMDPAGSIFG
jgi:hypothetical protein